MNQPFEELYKGYMLKCAPHPTPDKRFLANLVISFAQGGEHNDIAITPDRASFEFARDAADCSLAEGKRWVDNNG